MLELMSLSPGVGRLVDLFIDRYIGIDRVTTWSDGTPIIWRCSCGQPALVITKQHPVRGQVKSLHCLVRPHFNRPLTLDQCRWIEEVQSAELAQTSRRVPMLTVYSPIPIL